MTKTLLQLASTFARTAKVHMPTWGAYFAHALVDKTGKVIFDATAGGGTASVRKALELNVATTPLTGATITANALGLNEYNYITPAGTIAALTYVFPTDATSKLNQVIELVSTQIVTALTLTTAGLTIKGTAQTALAANAPARFRKVAASTWLVLA